MSPLDLSASRPGISPQRGTLTSRLAGLALSGALAALATALGRIAWLQDHGLSALTLAIVLGMVVGNTVYPRYATHCAAGIEFSKQKLLRLGVVLYGLRLTLGDIGEVGLSGLLIDALMVGSTFALACYLGSRWLGIDRKTTMLIGIGSSICGAAAVMAAEPVLRGRAEQVTVAVATVVAFGTVAIFLYPLLFQLNQHWAFIPGGTQGFGVYVGSTIHEVAQVVAAARSSSPAVADAAVIAKMVRVMMLAPFLLGLSAWLAREAKARGTGASAAAKASAPSPQPDVSVPWFAFVFIGVVLFNSMGLLSEPTIALATEIDTAILAAAMAALGISTHVSSVRRAGLKPLLLALILFGWLVVGGAAVNHGVRALLA